VGAGASELWGSSGFSLGVDTATEQKEKRSRKDGAARGVSTHRLGI